MSRAAGNVTIVNFRDLGGARTRDGRVVRKGLVYRSAAPDYSATDLEDLAALGVRYVCDLRSAGEQAPESAARTAAAGMTFVAPNADTSTGDPVTALARCTISTAVTLDLMHRTYRHIPVAQAETFARLFHRLADGDMPILIHCASGKDRTGVFTALLLHLLGVPREAILADYALTGEWTEQITRMFRDEPRHAPLIAAPHAVWGPLMQSNVAYLSAMFEALKAVHGSVDAYLEGPLGLSAGDQERLRDRLLDGSGEDTADE